MTVNEYQKMAMATLNPALAKKDVLINGVMGLCGEAGEAIDVVKKHLAQGHPLDREHLIQELGDVAWYLVETATALDVDQEEVFSRNIEKLRRRYPQAPWRGRSERPGPEAQEKEAGRDQPLFLMPAPNIPPDRGPGT